MSVSVNYICRVCLTSLTNRKYFNLYVNVAPGRTQQISTKIMACAWVQVFDGDGLPNHICCKCQDTLEIAYQFKQLCESSDTQLRQFFGRNLPNKTNNLDLVMEPRDYNADFKPINFNISGERTDLPQCDLSYNTLRLLNQDLGFVPTLQLGLPEQSCDPKEEPGYHSTLSPVLADLRPEQYSTFKPGSCVDGESLLSTFQAKLLEAVSESLSNSIPPELNENRLVAWDLQNKHHLLPVSEKSIIDISASIGQKVSEDNREESLSFLDDTRCILSPEKCTGGDSEQILEKHVTVKNQVDNLIGNDSLKMCINSENVNSKCEKSKSNQVSKSPCKSTKKGKIREQCELCGKVFRYSGYLQTHMRTHTDERPHTCSVCRQTFSMQHALVTHMRTHSGDKPYICTVCGKGFSQSSGLKSHMRLHSGEKPYQCEICSMKFAQSSNLKSHKMIHTGRRDHMCKICNTTFKFLKHLRSHQKTHYDDKEFKCPVCPKSFIRKRYLETHLSLHRGVKLHRCADCGNSFSSASNLRTHTRVHSGDKPYSCLICKKSFTQSNTLKRHLKQHRILATPQLAET